MPNCLLCNTAFPNKTIIDGKSRNLQRRKYCLSCSSFGEHNTTQIHKLDNHHIPLASRTGSVCSWHLCHNEAIRLGKFCGNKCKNKFYVDKRRKAIKLKALEYKGNKCVLCGYDKCVSSLDFHHTEPNAKDFAIAAKGCCRSWEKVKAELDKCILVCRNCHGEIHAGVTEIPVDTPTPVKKIELTPEQTEALAQASLDAQKRADEWREATKMTPELWNFRVTPFKQ